MKTIGRNIIRLSETDSTNLYAERLLKEGPVEDGTVITAGFQTSGRGQGDNTWESEPGKNLMATLILRPDFLDAGDQFLLNKAMTLAVCDLVRSAGITPTVKWPNDIYAGDRKIAGLLISHRVSGPLLEYTIIGIGVNLNQVKFPGTLPNPGSVKALTGVVYDPADALDDLIVLAGDRYGQLARGMAGPIGNEYLGLLRGFGKWQVLGTAGGEMEGLIHGVDEFGRLIVELRDGKTALFSHGEISLPPSLF